MKFQQVLFILRARSRVVLMSLAAFVVVSIAISVLLPKSYEASTTVVVNYKGSDPVSGAMMPSTMMTGYLATQVDIIQSKAVAIGVVDTLHLAEMPASKEEFLSATHGEGNIRDWVAEQLLKKLTVIPARESSVVTISFTARDPQVAALVANTFADEYQKANVRLKVQPLKQASAYFNEQIKSLRDKLEQAQSKLSKYQQDKGLVSIDNRLDVESSRLNDLSTQLVLVQSQAADASSRQREGQGAADSPDVVANPLVQNLKSSLAQAEAKLSELSQSLGVNHPQYQAARADVEKQRSELAMQEKLTYGSVGNAARIARQRQAQLEVAVVAQKTRILELNRERDQLAILARDVDSAQRTYDAAMSRFSDTSIQGGSNQADTAVLSPALPPIKASFPKPILNLALSIVFGTAFGMGLALLLEMLDQRVYSPDDVLNMQIPVLSDWTKPHKSQRRLFGLSKLLTRRRVGPA